MIRRFVLLPVVVLATYVPLHSQEIAVKSNLLYDVTTTLNLGAEVGVAEKWTLEASANYNPWKFGKNGRLKHWLIQPEGRYWLHRKFDGHFFGLQAHAGGFNVGGLKIFGQKRKNYRYQGHLYGLGLSYGYQWRLNDRWHFEAGVSIGWVRFNYDKYPCAPCGVKMKSDHTDYFGPTRLALSIVYRIK